VLAQKGGLFQLEGHMSERAILSDLLQALEFELQEHDTLFDRKTARIVTVSHEVMKALEEDDEDALSSIPDWQKEEINVGREILADEGNRFIDAPNKFEFHEYRQMEKFIASLPDEDISGQLWRAIKGKGAFRYFKDTLHRLGIEQQWYDYRDNAMKEFVIGWAESNDIPWIDDLKQRPGK
jgi:hypothetical protein